MTSYNPDFSRSYKGKFNLDNNFVSIKNGSEAYLIEDELNELQWIQNEQRSQLVRSLFTSGIPYDTLSFSDLNDNKDETIYIKGYGNTDMNNAILFNIKNYIPININGYFIKLAGTYKKDIVGSNTINNNILLHLCTPPISADRYDLVYLEVWFEEIDYQTNKDIKYYGGNSNNNIGTFNIDSRISVETTRRIQLKWNITTAANAKSMTDSTVFPRNNTANNNYVIASSISSQTYSKDKNLYISRNNNNVIDGTYYAIPLFTINRIAGKNTIDVGDIKKTDPIADINNHTHDKRYYRKDEIDVFLKIINDKDLIQDNRLIDIENLATKLKTNINNLKVGNNIMGYLKHTTNITTSTNQVEIEMDFNKDSDVLFVFKDTTYLDENIDYKISSDSKYIIAVGTNWIGTTTKPITFKFLIFKAISTNELEFDGHSITQNTIEEDRLVQSFIDKIYNHFNNKIIHTQYAVATGTNNYVVTLNPAPLTYDDGMCLVVKIQTDSNAACYIKANTLASVPIKKANGNAVTNLNAGSIYTMRYNKTTGNFILQGEGGSGNAIASDLRLDKTASTDAGDIIGTAPEVPATTWIVKTTDQTIASGSFLTGKQVIKGYPDLQASNILLDKQIGNIIGSMPNIGKQVITLTRNSVAIKKGYHDGTGYAELDSDIKDQIDFESVYTLQPWRYRARNLPFDASLNYSIFNAGEYVYAFVFPTTTTRSVYRFEYATNTWTTILDNVSYTNSSGFVSNPIFYKNNFIYFYGRQHSSPYLRSITAYNTTTNTFSTVLSDSDLEDIVDYTPTFISDGTDLFVYNDTTLYKMDIATNTKTFVCTSDIKYAHKIGNNLFKLDKTDDSDYGLSGSGGNLILLKYNISTNTPSIINNLPSPYSTSGNNFSSFPSIAIYNNSKIFLFSGRYHEYAGETETLDNVAIYDIASNTWSSGGNIPYQRLGMKHATYKNHIFCFGGSDSARVDIYSV